jgi:hypothetical protein
MPLPPADTIKPGQLFTDGAHVYEVVGVCMEPTVRMRRVDSPPAWATVSMSVSCAPDKHGGVTGAMWEKCKRLDVDGAPAQLTQPKTD